MPSRARDAVAAIAASTEAGFDPGSGLWPLHPGDVEPDVDHPARGLYYGAAGIIWALEQLDVELARDYGARLEQLDAELENEPDETGLPSDGFLGGRTGALTVAQRHRGDPARADLLLGLIAGLVDHPALELLYGSPGGMLAAAAEHERTGDPRFADVWRASADHLLDAWLLDDELGVRLWTQRLQPGAPDRYVGFGHGFAGNVFALLHGSFLAPGERDAIERDAIQTATRLAVVSDGLANWPAVTDQPLELASGIRTQWCHGAAGMVTALAQIGAGDDAWGGLLLAGGRLVWEAGPLRDSAGLCHGTAGNAYAFLKLFERTGDELWLERARRFAMHAVDQIERQEQPWHSLFTGDVGVALCLRSCLAADARFPALDFI
jgi:hypothetical protein